MADECGDAVGDSPSLLMDADNRRDWKEKKDTWPQWNETCSHAPSFYSYGALGWRQRRGWRDRGTTGDSEDVARSWECGVGKAGLVLRMGGDPPESAQIS